MNLSDKILKSRKYSKELRCIHRHSIEEHPACFAKGLIKWPNDRVFSRLTDENWFNYPGYKIGYLDIEVDNLDADWGMILTWCIKEKGTDKLYTGVITKEEIFNEKYDKRIVEELVNALGNFKILVGYYSTNFDMPFIRTRALHYGLEFPGYGDLYHWDLYYTVRNKLKLSRNSLDNATNFLGIKGKTPIEKGIWRRAKFGDEKALEDVLEHNIQDCIITEKLHDKLDFSRKWIRSSI